MKYCLLLLSMFVFSQVSAQSESPALDLVTRIKTGLATYYHKRFEGRKTTSGALYRRMKFTAAHMSLPFGTIVTVTNLSNGKSVDVEINDRGPYGKKYLIDLSERAAKELGFFNKVESKVSISYGGQS